MVAEIEEEIVSLVNAKETADRSLRALEKATEILSEVPSKITDCKLSLHLFCNSMVVETATCSECSRVSIGWDSSWKHCPLCGSRILEAEKETDPSARLQQDAINEAVNQLTGPR
jgi:DNA-directed RNA polymerase subunit RPC12/RpoP